MKSILKFGIAFAVIATMAAPAWAANNIILSTSNTSPVPLPNPIFLSKTAAGATAEIPLYIWVQQADANFQVAPPAPGALSRSSAALALNVTNGTPAVGALTGLSINNPTLTNGATRWTEVTAPVTGLTAQSIIDRNSEVVTPEVAPGPSAPNRGLLNANLQGGTPVDPGGQAGTTNFLWGTVTFKGTGFGTTAVSLATSGLGITTGQGVDNAPDITNDLTSQFTLGSASVRVALLGDANLDGTVDLGDINKVLGNWQAVNATWPVNGDVNQDGTVDLGDINTVLGNWQAIGGGSISVVPEPTGFVLAGLGACVFFVRRRFVGQK